MWPKVCLIIGIYGLNICRLAAQQDAWNEHLAAGAKFRAQARFQESEQEYLAAIHEAETPSPDDRRLAKSWNNLAALYQDTGRSEEAESLNRRAAELWERALGPWHPDLASSLSNWALSLRALDRTEEAERLYLRALAILEKLPEERSRILVLW